MSASRIIDNQHARVGRWVIERIGGIFHKQGSAAIGLEHEGKLIAGVLFDGYSERAVNIHLACDKPLTREFIWFCFYYAFEQLRVKKLLGMVESTNEKALRLNKKLGFVHEHTIKDGSKSGDMVILSMTREQCKWLNAVKRQGESHGQGLIQNAKNA